MKKFSLGLVAVLFIIFIAAPAFSADKQTITGKVVSFGLAAGESSGKFCVILEADGEFICYSDSLVSLDDLAIIQAHLVRAKERDEKVTVIVKVEKKAMVTMYDIYTIKFKNGAEFKIYSIWG